MGLIPTWPEDEVARAVTVTTTRRPRSTRTWLWLAWWYGFLSGAFAATTVWLMIR